MALQLSTGLRDIMMASGSLRGALNGGKIHIYAGAVPPFADSAESGTILCTITGNGDGSGLEFNLESAGGVLAKDPAQPWQGSNLVGGIATHYRFVAPGDTGGASSTEARIQGSVGVIGKDMNLSSAELISGAVTPIDYFVLTIPG